MYEYRRLSPEERRRLVEERVRNGLPPHAPPHPVRDSTCYLLTAACYEHGNYVSTAARRQELLGLLLEQSKHTGTELVAWVVLPNHYHLLAFVPDFAEVSAMLRRVHGVTSREWNLADGTLGRKVWYRYSDRAIRSDRHYYATVNYIHQNPVKHGWCRQPKDWAESSVHWYAAYLGDAVLSEWELEYPIREYGRGWDDW